MIETNNLFEVSMGKVVDKYGNLDTQASKYYTKAMDFQNQMNEKLATNKSELEEYQAMYYSMFKGQGINKDASYTMSESLTKAGYDIASLYNLSVKDAMDKIKSGIAGQVESLRTIGIDVSESSLSKVLNEVGIDRSVQQLSYAEKEVARYIAIIEQAGQAQGDFAKTFESPANQIRVFQNQLIELKQVAGSFIVNAFGGIIVWANAIIMAIKEIIKSIASLFGYDLSSGGSNNLADSIGVSDLNSGLGGATKKAKELKKQLMGFDEINNIDPASTTGGSGSSSGVATGVDDKLLKSLKEWDNKMNSITGKAQEYRDKILEALGFTKDINGKLKWSWKDMNNILKVLTVIAGIVGGILIIGKLTKLVDWLKTLFAIFMSGKGAITTFQVGLQTIGKVIGGFGGIFSIASIAILGLIAGLGYVYSTNEQVRNSVQEVIKTFQENLQPLLEFVSSTVIPDLQNAWNGLLEILSPLGEFINTVFTSCWNDFIIPALDYLASTVLPIVIKTFENLWNNILKPFAEFIGNVLKPVIQVVADVLIMLWKNVVVPLAQAVGELLAKAFEGICDVFNSTVVPIVNVVIKVLNFLWQNVLSPIINYLWETFKPIFEDVFKGIKSIIDGLRQTFGGLIDFITGVFSGNWSKAWEGIKNIFKGVWTSLSGIVSNVWDIILRLFSKGGQIFSGVVQGIANVFKTIVNTLIVGINKVIAIPFNGINRLLNKIRGIGIFDLKPFSFIPYNALPVPQIPKFAKGGMPDTGEMFIAREKGPEMVGKIGNKTTVANNNQIVTAIKQGVYEAVSNAMANGSNEVHLDIRTDEGIIVKKASEGFKEFVNRTGELPFPVPV